MSHSEDSDETRSLLLRLAGGDKSAIDPLLQTQRGYLRRVVDLRMEASLRARVDPSDVVQDTLIVASNRIDDFLTRRPTSFRMWIRRKAIERLIETRRKHQAGKRSVMEEFPLSDVSSLAIAGSFLQVTPSQLVQQSELAEIARQAMATLPELDREILVLRHIEELSNGEIAELLEISSDTASKRYGRAVRRLAQLLASHEA